MLFKKEELDERQLLMRGDVYKHAFFISLGLIFIDAFCTSFDISWIEGGVEKILIMLMLPIITAFIEMLLKEIITLDSAKIVVVILGINGVTGIIHFVSDVIIQNETLLTGKGLNYNGANFIYTVFMISAVSVYLYKWKMEKEEPRAL